MFKFTEGRLSTSSTHSLYCGVSTASESISQRKISFPFEFGHFRLSVKFAARQSSWKYTHGCNIVRLRQARQTIAPSSVMKLIWWFAKGPWKPAESSVTRKTDRIKIMTAAMQSPTRNERRGSFWGGCYWEIWLDEIQHCLVRKRFGSWNTFFKCSLLDRRF